MTTVIITGANRGIGLEFTRQYLVSGANVIATCRTPESADDLAALKEEHRDRLHITQLDVRDEQQIRRFKQQLKSAPIDILINNAGIYGPHENQLGEIDVDGWAKTFLTNTIAPIKVTEALLSNIFASSVRKVIFITSKMGSMDDNNSGGSYIYRSSKAALNAAGKSMAVDLAQKGVTVLLLHPGWVRTDMTGPSAPMTPSVSVSGMKKVIESTTVMDSGKFIAFDGKEINW